MPHAEPDLRHYLVAIDGGDAAYHALGVVLDLAKRSRAAVSVLHVIEVPRSLALEAEIAEQVTRGEEILARAEQQAADAGLALQADLVQARQAGPAVMDEAVDRGADAIVLGVEYHRPLGQFTLGRLPLYVLEHAPMQVWLIRYPATDPAR